MLTKHEIIIDNFSIFFPFKAVDDDLDGVDLLPLVLLLSRVNKLSLSLFISVAILDVKFFFIVVLFKVNGLIRKTLTSFLFFRRRLINHFNKVICLLLFLLAWSDAYELLQIQVGVAVRVLEVIFVVNSDRIACQKVVKYLHAIGGPRSFLILDNNFNLHLTFVIPTRVRQRNDFILLVFEVNLDFLISASVFRAINVLEHLLLSSRLVHEMRSVVFYQDWICSSKLLEIG